jgi:hypothetical protein
VFLCGLFSSFSFLTVVDPFERSDEPEHLPLIHYLDMCGTSVFNSSEIAKGLFKWSEQSSSSRARPSSKKISARHILLAVTLSNAATPVLRRYVDNLVRFRLREIRPRQEGAQSGTHSRMIEKRKRKPKREKPDDYGLERLLRKRKPRGGFVVFSKYIRLKSVAA